MLLTGSKVYLTDQNALLPLIEKNCQTNLTNSHQFQIEELLWGITDLVKFNPPFDYIVMSDVVYDESNFENLVKTLDGLSNIDTVIYLSYELRKKSDLRFFSLLLHYNFCYEKIGNDKLDEVYQSDDIGIFRIKKKTF
eukprot:TRINITY_DN1015_c0_g1_i1.p1 TRINITY_DN1015_c0_g1~~TRINITY_DN1015_c0_g1_i1.p1  ORF type:complete len:138 (-),score=24.31 TRINITY_DN1015_c0_g1_i1:63-476(-)